MDNNYQNQQNQWSQQNQQNQQSMEANSAYNTNYYHTGQNGYQNAYNPYQQQAGGPQNVRKPKNRKSGFGVSLAKSAAIALVFGLVAGSIFTGVSYAGTRAFGITKASAEEEVEKEKHTSGDSVDVQQTNTGEAADLLDVSDIAREAMPSIVAITNTGTISYQTFWGIQEQESESCGSGIIIKQDDKYLYIVTNYHVVADADTLTIQFVDDTTVSCEVKGTDEADDLAVVKVKLDSIEEDTKQAIRVATISEEENLEVGQGVIAIGNALGYGQSVTNGIISALGRTVTVQDSQTGQTIVNDNMIQTNAAINPGNSGGALLNASGEVIGINSAKYSSTDVEGFGYAIPMYDAMPIVEQLITKEKVEKAQSAYLGIQGQDISSDIAQAYNMPEGVYIYQVISNSAAEKAGLRQGDIITGFDGQKITTMSQLKELLAYYEAGQEVEITFERLGDGYKEITVDATLGAMSDARTNY